MWRWPSRWIWGHLHELGTPERYLLSLEIASTVQEALDKLPENLRTVIMLRELEGLSYEGIANAMSCPVGTVRARIFRAREAIDKRLQPLARPMKRDLWNVRSIAIVRETRNGVRPISGAKN